MQTITAMIALYMDPKVDKHNKDTDKDINQDRKFNSLAPPIEIITKRPISLVSCCKADGRDDNMTIAGDASLHSAERSTSKK